MKKLIVALALLVVAACDSKSQYPKDAPFMQGELVVATRTMNGGNVVEGRQYVVTGAGMDFFNSWWLSLRDAKRNYDVGPVYSYYFREATPAELELEKK